MAGGITHGLCLPLCAAAGGSAGAAGGAGQEPPGHHLLGAQLARLEGGAWGWFANTRGNFAACEWGWGAGTSLCGPDRVRGAGTQSRIPEPAGAAPGHELRARCHLPDPAPCRRVWRTPMSDIAVFKCLGLRDAPRQVQPQCCHWVCRPGRRRQLCGGRNSRPRLSVFTEGLRVQGALRAQAFPSSGRNWPRLPSPYCVLNPL